MRILSLETSTANASASIFENSTVVLSMYANPEKRHAESVIPMIDSLLNNAEMKLTDFDFFAVDVGPGSFTGIRIGIAVMNAFAYSTGIKIIPVSSLFALSMCNEVKGKTICSIIDARNNNVYAASYTNGIETLSPGAYTLDDIILKDTPETVYIGDVVPFNDRFPSEKCFPDSVLVALAAFKRTKDAISYVKPEYYKLSQAERKRV